MTPKPDSAPRRAEPIHVIKEGKDGAWTTLCGAKGRRSLTDELKYETAGRQGFRAVLASDPHRGFTCRKCRQVASAIRSKGANQ